MSKNQKANGTSTGKAPRDLSMISTIRAGIALSDTIAEREREIATLRAAKAIAQMKVRGVDVSAAMSLLRVYEKDEEAMLEQEANGHVKYELEVDPYKSEPECGAPSGAW